MAAKTKNVAGLDTLAAQIKSLERKTLANVIEIGRLLELASDVCAHGQYEEWLKAHFGWSFTTAHRYRDVAAFCKSTKLVDLSQLDISLSALYLAAHHGAASPQAKAIIAMAKKERVTYSRAKGIVEQVEQDRAAEKAARLTTPPDVLDIGEQSDRDTFPFEPKAKPPIIEPLPDEDEAGDDDHNDCRDHGDVSGSDTPSEPVRLLRRLGVLVCKEQLKLNWSDIIDEVGSSEMRETLTRLKNVFDQHNSKKATKARADAAEVRSKLN